MKFGKGVRYLLLMRSHTLEEHEKRRPGSQERLKRALELNEPLNKGYYLKEKLCQLWEAPDRKTAAEQLHDWVQEAMASGVKQLRQLSKTVVKYTKGILAYFDHGRISSGMLEGINNKIKTMKRMAYGFRDDEFFKLKILGLHEARYKLLG